MAGRSPGRSRQRSTLEDQQLEDLGASEPVHTNGHSIIVYDVVWGRSSKVPIHALFHGGWVVRGGSAVCCQAGGWAGRVAAGGRAGRRRVGRLWRGPGGQAVIGRAGRGRAGSVRAGSDKRPQLHRVRAVVGRVGGALRRSVHTWSGLQSNGSRGRARVGWEVGESTRGWFPRMSGRAVFGRVSGGPPAVEIRTVRAVSAGPARTGRVPGVSDYKWHRGWPDVGRRSGGSAGVVLRSGWTDVGRPGDCGGCG